MDGVSDATAIAKRAHDWGHPAIAITDHGVVQAFTEANHYIENLGQDDPFKIIYGVEAYLVDDLTDIAVRGENQTLDDTYVVFDIETTGFSALSDQIIEIGALKVKDGKVVDRFIEFVKPDVPITSGITGITGITNEMVANARDTREIICDLVDFCGDDVLIGHNIMFDY